MRKILLALLVCFLVIGCATVQSDTGKIEISGSGSVTATPDIAVFSISLESLKDTTSEAVNELKTLQANVLKVLTEDCNIDEDDIVSTYLNFAPSYSWIDGKQVLNGQRASSSYSVTVRNLDSLGAIYDKLSAISTISLSNISLQVEDNSQFVAEARKEAMDNAVATATLYAESLGMRLGDAIYVNEGSSSRYYEESVVYPAAKMMMASNADTVDYRQDDITISANVNVVFELIK